MLEGIDRILVSRLRYMGDVILTTPLIRALRKAYPEAHISYLTEREYAPLVENNPHLDEIIPFDRGKSFVTFMWELRKRRFDLAIDLLGLLPSALLTYATRARYRVGGDFRIRRYFYNVIVKDNGSWRTAIDYHLMSLKPLGIEPDGMKTEIFLTERERIWAREYLASKGFDLACPIVGLHPGGTWPAKRWPWEKFAELAHQLSEELKTQVFLSQGPGEQELIQRILMHTRGRVIAGEVLPLRRLAAVLRELKLYISNDCGPMHLAVAVGTKTLGIFGPGEPWIWFPYEAQGHRAIYKEIDCRPCHRHQCPSMRCMELVRVEDVIEVIRAFFS